MDSEGIYQVDAAIANDTIKEIEVKPGKAAIVYSIPTPDDSPIGGADFAEVALNGRVRSSVRRGGLRIAMASHGTSSLGGWAGEAIVSRQLGERGSRPSFSAAC